LDQIAANVKTLLTNLATQGTIMAEDFTALNASLDALKVEVGDIGGKMDVLFADWQAAVGTGNQPAIDAAAAAVQAEIDNLKAIAARDMPPNLGAPPTTPAP
jgi:hypothetical protein